MEGFQDIGQRIVQAARLAVAVHLYESAAKHTSPTSGEDLDAVSVAKRILHSRRWSDRENGGATGGAGQTGIAAAAAQTPPRLGDLVTDDERDGLMGLGDPGDEP